VDWIKVLRQHWVNLRAPHPDANAGVEVWKKNKKAHKEGVDRLHADPMYLVIRHAAWIGALKDRWDERRADPEAMVAGFQAHKEGLRKFHADPAKHCTTRSLAEGHI